MKPLRICILGNSGSGKSTLADALGKHYTISVYHLDRELLHGQFQPYPYEEQKIRHASFVAGENWVIDGNYRSLLPERAKRATHIIFLDVSRTTTLPRIIRRYFTKSHLSKSIPEQAKDGLSWQFLKFVARYSRNSWKKHVQTVLEQHPSAKLIILRPGTTSQWIQTIIKSTEQD